MTFVPYPGNAPALNAVLSQQVTAMFGTYSNVAGYLKAGTLRALAVATPTRAEPLPDVPTVAESGYKDFDVERLVRRLRAGEHTKGYGQPTRGVVRDGDAGPEVKEKLLVQEILSRRAVRCGFRSFHSQTIRRLRSRHGRGKDQGGVSLPTRFPLGS